MRLLSSIARHRPLERAMLLVGATLLLAACENSNEPDGSSIGTAGGTIAGDSGRVTLVVPANALTSSVRVVAERASSGAGDALMVPGTAYEITPRTQSLAQAATLTIQYDRARIPAAAADSELTIVRVDGGGLVELASTVDAASGKVSAPVSRLGTFYVRRLAVGSVAVSPTTVSTFTGATVQLSATRVAEGGRRLGSPTLRWTSDNAGVATVSGTGLVTAVAPGTARVTVESEGRAATTTVVVAARRVASVTVTPSSARLLPGQTATLQATPVDSVGFALRDRAVVWSSSNEAVAQVSGSGVVTARAIGTATITARSEGFAGTATITVAPVPVREVLVSPDSVTLQVWDVFNFGLTLRDSTGAELTDREVTWTTDSPQVIELTRTGGVGALRPGRAVVTATVEGRSDQAVVIVVAVPVARVTLAPDAPTAVTVGDTVHLSATARDAQGRDVTDQYPSVQWTSDDATIATVEASGTTGRLGIVTGVKAGTATITATVGGFSLSRTVTVQAAAPSLSPSRRLPALAAPRRRP